MIRFFDKEVECMDLEQYDRDVLFRYFLNKRSTDIVLLYDGAEYYGMVTYKSVLGRTNGNGILLHKCVMKEDTDLFSDLHAIFALNPADTECIPVFTPDMQLLYFAYQYNTNVMTVMENTTFPFLEQEEDILFIDKLYPQVKKVCIYDFNEFAFRFYQILKKRNFPVEVFGEKWSVFYPMEYEREQIQFGDAPSDGIMNIYAEGNYAMPKQCSSGQIGYELGEVWNFLLDIMTANTIFRMEKWKEDLRRKNIPAFTMIFPDFKELDEYTLDEYYRHSRNIQIASGQLNVCNELVVDQVNKCWCKESENGNKYEEAMWVNERKNALRSEKPAEMQKLNDSSYSDSGHTLYLIGPCIVGGASVDEEDSFGSCISRELRNYSEGYSVRCKTMDNRDVLHLEKIIKSLTLCEGDIVVMIGYNEICECNMGERINGYPGDIDVKEILKSRRSDWFWDCPIHTNQKGNAKIAEMLVKKYLAEHLRKADCPDKEKRILQAGQCFLPVSAEEEIRQYIKQVKADNADNTDKTGAIVMNCNPMIRGHQYLIEQALQRVDFLYIFVVEEDKSEFPFADRLKMVQAVTEKYENVKVIPSGRFVLSYETMPLYFEKAQKQEETLDAAGDLKIFGDKIAPQLGIKIRFVGEEPGDKITRQYNEMMKKMLPLYGIQTVEVPRLELKDEVVSASAVRRYWCRGEMDKVRQLVPEEVYHILLEERNVK